MRQTTKAALAALITAACSAPAAAQEMDGPPVAPPGLVASFVGPAHDADGYVTPNRYLSAAETAWHVRAALNVAALNCRGAGDDARTAAYNALLAQQGAPLAAASKGTEAAYRARYGAGWQDRLDGDMTRLYNFWAEPGAHAAFCAAADQVLADASVTEPAAFGPFAAAALVRLEAPFLAFFAAAEHYRTDLAAWRAAQAPAQVAAAPSSTPVQVAAALPPPQPEGFTGR